MKHYIRWYDIALGRYFQTTTSTMNSILKELNCKINETGFLSMNEYVDIIKKWTKDEFSWFYQSEMGFMRVDNFTFYTVKTTKDDLLFGYASYILNYQFV